MEELHPNHPTVEEEVALPREDDFEPEETTDPDPVDNPSGEDGYPVPGGGFRRQGADHNR